MALKCFKTVAYGATSSRPQGQLVTATSDQYPGWRCANSITTVVDTILSSDANPYYAGCLAHFLVIDGVQTREWSPQWDILVDSGNPNCPPSCGGIPTPYDCVNGQCVRDNVYGTPGQYDTLEECQAECGTGNACQAPNICVPPDHCPDGYVCIGSDEWVEIKRLLS